MELLQDQKKWLEEVHRKNVENKKKREELMKWLNWACNDPDIKNVWIKNKNNGKFYNIKGEKKWYGAQ